jgi:CRISP-associated protein Cas1
MKKLLNTLYVSTQGVYLHREGETVVAEREKQVVLRLPIHTLSAIVCFGNVLVSPFLMGLCAERGVHVSFLTENGRPLARVEGGKTGNVLLRVAQIEAARDPAKCAAIARSFVIGKVLNARNVLQRRLRDHGDDAACASAVTSLANVVQRLKNANDVEVIRGLEGEAASDYFAAFNSLIVAQKDDFRMEGRTRRPPRDPMNALLSFLYVLLANDCAGAAKSVGLDAQVGFLHALRSGRASLAFDLMEEFRAFFADRVALSLVNRGQIRKKDFKFTESGAVEMSETARKTVLVEWQNRKKDDVVHPFLNERVAAGLLPFVQAQLLAKHLRNDLDAYPPFLVK